MRALIVQRNADLGLIWQRHLERLDVQVARVHTQEDALQIVQTEQFDVVVLDLMLAEGCALVVADLVQFRQPEANVVFVTDTTFFSDGSIFHHSANARTLIKTATPPKDLAAIVHYYGASCPDHVGHHSPALG